MIFAKAAGATTIITSSSDEKLEYIKTTYGADYTVNYKTHPHWAAEINRITNGGGVDQIIEVGGVGTIEQSLESVAWGGIVNVIGFLSSLADGASMPNVTFQTLAKGAILRGILAGSKQQLEEAVRFIAAQELSVPVDKTFSFTRDDIISAFKYVESGRHIGKVCINLE